MNFVCFSPQFPPNFRSFWIQLSLLGATVLGLSDAPYDELPPELKGALAEYYRVQNPHNYDEMVRALGYFTHRYGKIDRFESHNEYWLESDARLRTDFNIFGLKTPDMAPVKQKSEMKKRFQKAGIPVARGRVCHALPEAQALIDTVGFPVVAKPDNGVGANQTYKITCQAELENFFAIKPPPEYIFEEFVEGAIQTFDGLVDREGRIVFSSSLTYNAGVMELVNERRDFWYYTLREIPPELDAAGRRLVNAYGLRERFFHLEFFCTGEGQYTGLEINVRPPGGLTVDMWNYANDIDIYREYASVVVNDRFNAQFTRPFYCAYISRRWDRSYLYSHEQVLAAFPGYIVSHEPISGIFAPALGDYGYLARSPELGDLAEISQFVHQLAG
jgi:hypothetical protein